MQTEIIWHPGWVNRVLSEAPAGACIESFGHRLAGEITAAIPVHSGRLKQHWGGMAPRVEHGSAGFKAELPIGSAVWHLVEFGSIHNPPYAPIRRGADNAGLQIDMSVRSG